MLLIRNDAIDGTADKRQKRNFDMTVLYEKHQEILLEIFYTEDGYCYASCEPFKLEILESELCNSPKRVFDRLKEKINFIDTDYEEGI
ncbi:MAG: hypothetical protein V7K32_17025 [Nostoc sp.]|uniref:hypothetical protein n=1 Tax=Nostoc sp. TaxID=1180 RepID=UPI002FF77D36